VRVLRPWHTVHPEHKKTRRWFGTTPGFQFGAGNETRTRDPDLGKVVLYQLSYSRFEVAYFKHITGCVNVNLQ
jgi:hypothetical protein